MVIGSGYRCGLGNFIIYSNALRALATLGEVDLILDDDFANKEAGESIILMARGMPFIREIVRYPSEFNEKKYDKLYMSRHSILTSAFYRYVYKDPHLKNPKIPLWASTHQHERDFYYQEIIEQFGYDGPIFPQFMPSAIMLPVELPKKPFISIANGFKRSDGKESHIWECKSYPHFEELIETIMGYYPGVSICLLGGPGDWDTQNLVQKVGKNAQKVSKILDFSSKLNVLETAAVVRQSAFVITNDSFVAHVADALRRPGIVLFGPSLVSKNAPTNGTLKAISSSYPCAPCQGTLNFLLCKDRKSCMAAISLGRVMSLMRKMVHFS